MLYLAWCASPLALEILPTLFRLGGQPKRPDPHPKLVDQARGYGKNLPHAILQRSFVQFKRRFCDKGFASRSWCSHQFWLLTGCDDACADVECSGWRARAGDARDTVDVIPGQSVDGADALVVRRGADSPGADGESLIKG